jgi:type II secretory pathway predicted ATPase ExeA
MKEAYSQFYGFRVPPFNKTPDPSFLYLSRMHSEALERMKLAVEEKDIVLITGEIGCGKTTLIRALVDSLEKNYIPILISSPRLSPFQFLKVLLKKFGIDGSFRSRVEIIDRIEDEIFQMYEKDMVPVIIIDEAQTIPQNEVFEDLRLLTNFQLDDENLFSLIIVGQPELRKRLSHPKNKAFWQRIGIHYVLNPFDLEDTEKYIKFRLKKAGGKEDLFSHEAIEKIHHYSEGIPRMINHICSNALIEGFSRDAKIIKGDIIEAVVQEMLPYPRVLRA